MMSDFEKYMSNVYSQLECNMTGEMKEENPFNIFSYTEEEINKHIDYFHDCFESEISPYKALTLFYYETNSDN